MIKSFSDKKLQNFYTDGKTPRGFSKEKLAHVLTQLDAAEEFRDLSGLDVKDEGNGVYSVAVGKNYKIVFRPEKREFPEGEE
ncbi:MAG: type II toxin-antitoxin system RelE/ParE family toxin [Candidatus Gastranaerophilaceae bacterium]